MTATVSLTPARDHRLSPPLSPTASASALPASPPARVSLAPAGSAPALLDGAWWPRSRDLTAELPALAAVLDPLWGRITHVTVNPTLWPAVPRRVPVAGHAVNVGWFLAEQDPHVLLLLSYRVGRWDLLVVPPETSAADAARLMAAASDPRRTATASRLVDEATRPPAPEPDPVATAPAAAPALHLPKDPGR